MFNLFKKNPEILIEDIVFGKLKYINRKHSPLGFFSGVVIFKPLNKNVECLINAEITGPTNEQREFYKTVESKYFELIELIKTLVESELRDWNENLKVSDFNKDFELLAISIPQMGSNPIMWDMVFRIVHDEGGHDLTITFKDFTPESTLIDG